MSEQYNIYVQEQEQNGMQTLHCSLSLSLSLSVEEINNNICQ